MNESSLRLIFILSKMITCSVDASIIMSTAPEDYIYAFFQMDLNIIHLIHTKRDLSTVFQPFIHTLPKT